MFFIKSEEEISICPDCGEPLDYHSRVIRPLRDITGKEELYNIRVLKCVNKACPSKYHRELPDIIVPYKRYSAESIENAIGQDETIVAADESTIYRWRKWFNTNATYITMALLGVLITIAGNKETSSLNIEKQRIDAPVEWIKTTTGRTVRWLSEIVRILVNSSRWIVNRSAFLSG